MSPAAILSRAPVLSVSLAHALVSLSFSLTRSSLSLALSHTLSLALYRSLWHTPLSLSDTHPLLLALSLYHPISLWHTPLSLSLSLSLSLFVFLFPLWYTLSLTLFLSLMPSASLSLTVSDSHPFSSSHALLLCLFTYLYARYLSTYSTLPCRTMHLMPSHCLQFTFWERVCGESVCVSDVPLTVHTPVARLQTHIATISINTSDSSYKLSLLLDGLTSHWVHLCQCVCVSLCVCVCACACCGVLLWWCVFMHGCIYFFCVYVCVLDCVTTLWCHRYHGVKTCGQTGYYLSFVRTMGCFPFSVRPIERSFDTFRVSYVKYTTIVTPVCQHTQLLLIVNSNLTDASKRLRNTCN